MAKRVVDWRGNKIEKFGRLLIADQLVVTREGVDYNYLVYVFDRIVVFAADSKTGGRLRQCLVGRKAYEPFFKAGTRSTPLKMKGSVYMTCVMGAVPLAEDRVPCECKAGRPAFGKSAVLSRRMWKLTWSCSLTRLHLLQFLPAVAAISQR